MLKQVIKGSAMAFAIVSSSIAAAADIAIVHACLLYTSDAADE